MTHRILIVEDNKAKQERIANIIQASYPASIEFVFTISSAYAILEHRRWDLVVLDMTFQISQGIGQAVQKEALAGIELLQYMVAKGLKYPVIVATQHDVFSHGGWMTFSSISELDRSLAEAFPGIYKSTVRVDLANSDWHEDLLAAVQRVLDADNTKNSGH
jgi:CheY-like chemotaxis protein